MNPSRADLSVLSSSSSGNCSVLRIGDDDDRRLVLLDAGLSPRQTRRMLSQVGESDRDIHAVVLTHLDADHFHAGWLKYLRRGIPIWVHRAHLGRAERCGITYRKTEVFTDAFSPSEGVRVQAHVASHDDLGVASFRVELESTRRTLGYATDVGRPTPELVAHLAGVDVLAIESNYCPEMQLASNRPEFLKRRIMGGAGHLSNHESAQAVRRIQPREHVVLLHLSRQCNSPETASLAHRHALPVTVSSPEAPTPWIPVSWEGAAAHAGQGRKFAEALWSGGIPFHAAT